MIQNSYYIKTFGCQMNKADSERIGTVLDTAGFKKSSEDEADVLIVNVCSVRERAVDRVYALLNKWQNKGVKVIVTGCVLGKDKKNFEEQAYYINIKNITQLPFLIRKKESKDLPRSYLEIKPQCSNNFSAFVPVMNGCNNFCSYCIVPYTRGREYSRPASEIISEVKGLIKKGYKEIVLLGQNVNSYKSKVKRQKAKGKATSQKVKVIRFPELLKMVNNISGDFWIRFITSHPKDMSDELIQTIASCPKVCEYIHLPIQSGDNLILKKMNRQYTVQDYLGLIKKIRDKIPNVAISTDIIVGFPGETKKQFQNTVKVFKKVGFDMAYIARYSPRPQTAAWELNDNVSAQEKKRRYNILNKLLQKTALEKNKKLIGKNLKILIDKKGGNYYYGKTRGFKTARIKSNKNLIGQFVKTKITQANSWGLLGKTPSALPLTCTQVRGFSLTTHYNKKSYKPMGL